MLDLLTVGETMLAVAPLGGSFRNAVSLRCLVAGGESNVAAHVASRGHRAAWASRVGDDPAGDRVLTELEARGIDLSYVEVDLGARTGLMLKSPAPGGSRVDYYRADSAASRMGPEFVTGLLSEPLRIVHFTGVTPILSAECGEMVDQLVRAVAQLPTILSFDVNHRAALWKGGSRSAALELAALARRADVCFVGRDEAESLWGTATPNEIRGHLRSAQILVVKDGDRGATVFAGEDAPEFVPSHSVTVVEPVGAGDAFAGGFLAGLLEGKPHRACLQLGHDLAAQVLATVDDLPPLPAAPRKGTCA